MAKFRKLEAFSLLEIVIVLALSSLVITLVTYAINRLLEKVEVVSLVHKEINGVQLMINVLEYDYYQCDSLLFTASNVSLYFDDKMIVYSIDRNQLLNRISLFNNDVVTNVTFNVICSDIFLADGLLSFRFLFKVEEVLFSVPILKDDVNTVNTFFIQKSNGFKQLLK